MPPPRVLHLAPLGGITGALRSMQTLVGELVKHGPTFAVTLEEGDEARLLRDLGAETTAVFAPGGLPRRRLPRWSRLVATIRDATRRQRIELLHCHSAQLMRYAWPVSVVTGVPVLCHQRELYERLPTQRGLGRAHHIVAISDAVERSLPRRWRRRTTRIYNAVLGPPALPARRRSHGPLRVGVAGRVVPEKGQDLLIDVAVALMERFDIEVHIWGLHPHHPPNAYARSLFARIESLGAHARRFHLVPMREDMETFYQAADVVVVPSRWVEPLGRVAIEAMAWGCPVLAAGHGGLLEVVDDEHTGLTFTPGDRDDLERKLARLLSDEPLRDRLREQGRAGYERRFKPERHAARMIELYAQVLDRR